MKRAAFTLTEVLVVIVIIAILAGLSLSAMAQVKKKALVDKAKMQMNDLALAIEAYDTDYGRFPASEAAQSAAAARQSSAANNGDFTYGGPIASQNGGATAIVGTVLPTGDVLSNSEVVSILMSITTFPNNPSQSTVDAAFAKNPAQTKFLNATMVNDPALPGVGPDLVYRDPWGNPYVITMDLNFDGLCDDSFYGRQAVSSPSGTVTGLNGLFNEVDPAGSLGNHFQFHGKVMIWSAGPDQKVDPNLPANQGVNKDNVISWQ